MLPDFSKLKLDIATSSNRLLAERRRHHAKILSELKQRRLFEGKKSSIARPDEAEEQTEMVHLSAEVTIQLDDLHEMSLPQLLERHDVAVKSIAEQQMRYFFETINQVTEKTGNVVNGQGRPFGPELLFEVIEKIHIDFLEDGTAVMPTAVLGSEQMAAISKASSEFENDSELQERFARLMEKKREEWRAREANRTLAG